MNWRLGRAVVLGFLFCAACLMCAGSSQAQNAAATFKAKCAGCHGADGKGNTGAGKALGVHDFTSPAVQKMTDEELTEAVTKGKNKMPAYGSSMSAAEIKDLVAYVRELGGKK